MIQFLQFAMHSEVLHFCLYVAACVLVDGMPAPTKDSSVAYQWAFKSFNIFAANWLRSKNTAIENSPNFQDALNIQTDKAGLPRIDVQKPDSHSGNVTMTPERK